MLGKPDLNERGMRKVVFLTAEPAYTREATDKMVKILDSTYAKEYLKQGADNENHLNSEEITQLLRLLEDF